MRAMKDSGVEWIGEIPEGWYVAKVTYFYDIQLGKMLQPQPSSPDDVLASYLCASNISNNILQIDSLKQMWFSEADRKSLLIKKGDLLVVEGGDIASSAIFDQDIDGLYFQNAILRVSGNSTNDVRILRYWLMAVKSIGHIDLICNKATIAHFSKEKFLTLPFIVISVDEQHRIADFLDSKCAQIDAIIEKQQQVIEKLKAYKQSVITEAVTKGLDSTVPMKDSGVEWIGMVPEHWEIRKLKYETSMMRGRFSHRPRNDPDYYDGDFPFVQTGDVARANKYITDYSQTLNELGFSVSKEFPKGSIVMTIAANVGDVAVLDFDACFPDSVIGFVPHKSIHWNFMYYVFKSMKNQLLRNAIIRETPRNSFLGFTD